LASQVAVKRRPKFNLRFISEYSEYQIQYDAGNPDNNFMTESVVSMTTKNAMDDDSAAFSVTLAGDMEWDKILTENDLMILRLEPNELNPNNPTSNDRVQNNILIVGLISEVRLEGEYEDNSKMYRITGQSFQKAFIQFNLQIIQQAGMIMADRGWMDIHEGEGGFTQDIIGSTIKEVVDTMLGRFIPYMQYNFGLSPQEAEGNTENIFFSDRLAVFTSSWESEEELVNPIPFTSFEGSLNQLIKDVTTQPFCEFFFDVFEEPGVNGGEVLEKASLNVRRTPFNREDWVQLDRHNLSSRDVKIESVARNDLEAFSIFNVVPESDLNEGAIMNAVPYYHPSLVSKYGYQIMEVSNRFLSPESLQGDQVLGQKLDELEQEAQEEAEAEAQEESEEEQQTAEGQSSEFTVEDWWNIYNEQTSMGTPPDMAMQTANNIAGDLEALEAAEEEAQQQESEDNTGGESSEEGSEEDGQSSDPQTSVYSENPELADAYRESSLASEYSRRLYDWYAMNPNFYAGDITVLGHPDYRIGNRLLYHNEDNNDFWEYYIESVEHNYSYTGGYTTTLGVTRGLRLTNQNDFGGRFNPPMGDPEIFKGGYLGEASLEDMERMAQKQNQSGNSSGEVTEVSIDGITMPVQPMDGTTKTSSFGMRTNPVSGEHKLHAGTDLSGGSSQIVAILPGSVVTNTNDPGGWGNYIVIDHGDLDGVNLQSLYAHLSASNVSVGQEVNGGNKIGTMGTTGNSTGVHLHIEIHEDGTAVDPEKYLIF